jgi:hypothetical protein
VSRAFFIRFGGLVIQVIRAVTGTASLCHQAFEAQGQAVLGYVGLGCLLCGRVQAAGVLVGFCGWVVCGLCSEQLWLLPLLEGMCASHAGWGVLMCWGVLVHSAVVWSR